MSALTREARAAAAPSALESLLGRGRGVRFAAALVAGGAGELLSAWIDSAPALQPLATTPFVSFTAGVLLGWPGVLGSALGQALGHWLLSGLLWASALLALCFGSASAIAWLVFRHVRGLGRGLPDLRSYLWMLASALLGGLLFALAGRTLSFGGDHGAWAWTWSAGSLVNVLVFAPPVLLAADRRLRPWMAPIPGELPARRSHRFSHGLPRSPGLGGEETLMVARPRPQLGRAVAAGSAMVAATSAVVVPLVSLLPQGGAWTVLLYLVPILWAALNYGLRGGVLAASASGIALLLGLALLGEVTAGSELWGAYADLVILSVTSAFVGWSRESEARLRDELLESNRLLRRDLLRVVQALTNAVEVKDAYTEGHLHRVSEYAVAVGERLGLSGRDLETLHYASMLHDVGKLGIPEQVLGKVGPLDDQEAEVMRRHPEIGARILEKLDLLGDVAPLVLHHQERYDGGRDGEYPGYPQGLAGDLIPLGARIIAVVDAFDAMTTTRPYREALPVERAVAELRSERGRQFDPRVVDAFLAILAERPWNRAAGPSAGHAPS